MSEPLVNIKKWCDFTGMTENSVRALIKKGHWRLRTHYTKAPNGRIFIDVEKAKEWQRGIRA